MKIVIFLIYVFFIFLGITLATPCTDIAPSIHCSIVNPWDCYNPVHRQNCCGTCESFRRDIPGCAYGDLTPEWCENSAQCQGKQDYEDCCETCYKHKKEFEAWRSSIHFLTSKCPRIDQRLPIKIMGRKVTCTEMATHYRHYCYDLKVKNRCCYACENVNLQINGCNWGDRDKPYCARMNEQTCEERKQWLRCCATCMRITGVNEAPDF